MITRHDSLATGRFKYRSFRPAEERFWDHVEITPTCWLWTACKGRGGYGYFAACTVLHQCDDQKRLAHRFAYEMLVGPIPAKLTIDHLCRVPHCVNPDHMEVVTRAENSRRGCATKTACKYGHEYTPANTGHSTLRSNGKEYQVRYCRVCKKEAARIKQGYTGLGRWPKRIEV